jgi:hypothetical protein
LFLSAALGVRAAEPLGVVINEIAWMGTSLSSSDEWIELYNNTENPVVLDNWQLVSRDGTPKINLTGTIPAFSFYLLERTDDNAVPEITADKTYSGALSNAGESLELLDDSGKPIDKVDCSSGWFSGNNSTKQTMERKTAGSAEESENWQTSQTPGGTPKIKNSSGESQLQQTTQEIALEDLPPVKENYPVGLVINEILPSPEGQDEKEEWIEIFNQNDFETDISYWQIVDTVGQTKTYTFPVNTIIKAKGFLVLDRPTTKITLNNSEDGLLFIQPNGNTTDSVNYLKAAKGQSYSRTENNWVWSAVLTPGENNMVSLPAIQPEDSQKEKQFETQQLAAISQQIPKTPFAAFFIALGFAVLSGTIIIFTKKKLT